MEMILNFELSALRFHLFRKQVMMAFLLVIVFTGMYGYLSWQSSLPKTAQSQTRSELPAEPADLSENSYEYMQKHVVDGPGSQLAEIGLTKIAPAEIGLTKKSLPEAKAEDMKREVIMNEASSENIVSSGDVLPEALQVSLYGNGGTPEYGSVSGSVEEFSLDACALPQRPGKLFDGWYMDAECTTAFQGSVQGMTELKLYAGWKEFPGFLSDDEGMIIGYTDAASVVSDNLAVLPDYDNCIGIRCGAFHGLENDIYELYLPDNITYVEEGALDALSNLMYIEVAPANSAYYSKNGALYQKDGLLIKAP